MWLDNDGLRTKPEERHGMCTEFAMSYEHKILEGSQHVGVQRDSEQVQE